MTGNPRAMGALRRGIQCSVGGQGELPGGERAWKVSPKARGGVMEAQCRSMEGVGASAVEAKGTACTKPQRDVRQ